MQRGQIHTIRVHALHGALPPAALLNGAILEYGVTPAVSMLRRSVENGIFCFELPGRPKRYRGMPSDPHPHVSEY